MGKFKQKNGFSRVGMLWRTGVSIATKGKVNPFEWGNKGQVSTQQAATAAGAAVGAGLQNIVQSSDSNPNPLTAFTAGAKSQWVKNLAIVALPIFMLIGLIIIAFRKK